MILSKCVRKIMMSSGTPTRELFSSKRGVTTRFITFLQPHRFLGNIVIALSRRHNNPVVPIILSAVSIPRMNRRCPYRRIRFSCVFITGVYTRSNIFADFCFRYAYHAMYIIRTCENDSRTSYTIPVREKYSTRSR